MTKRYTVTVITGTRQHADTRANVFIRIQGALGVGAETPLPGEFGLGSTREFPIDSADLGNLQNIQLRHDDTGSAPAWFLDKVLITDELGAKWLFAGGLWISGTTPRTLVGELLKPGTEVPVTLWTGWAWGRNDLGQLGIGSNRHQFQPAMVPHLNRVGFNALATGDNFSLALLDDGGVWAWGIHEGVGDGTDVIRYVPVDVMHLARFKTQAIAAGGASLALLKDGTVLTWGNSDWNRLGAGDTGLPRHNVPLDVLVPGDVKDIAAGNWHGMALLKDGTVMTWGHNGQGQLGSGNVPDRMTPGRVEGLTGIKAIAAGFRHCLALQEDGSLWAWGHNAYGQLGDGTAIQRNTPVKLANIAGVKAISASSVGADTASSLALLEDGTVWAWGANDWSQLGDNTTTHRNTPVRVSGLTEVKAISAGGWHCLALKQDGSVWGWGANDFGQLGIGSNSPNRYAVPVRVPNLTGIKAISAGGRHCVVGG